MGLTADVVDGAVCAVPWANEIRDRTCQVFASTADRDTWPTPPNGATCVTLDTGLRYQRVAGAWVTIPTNAAGLVGAGFGTTGTTLGPYTGTGMRDILTISPSAAAGGGVLPYATFMTVTMAMQFGADVAATSGIADMQRIADASIAPHGGTVQAAAQNAWACVTLHWRFTVAANAGTDYKCRLNVTLLGAANLYVFCTSTWQRTLN